MQNLTEMSYKRGELEILLKNKIHSMINNTSNKKMIIELNELKNITNNIIAIENGQGRYN